MGSMCCAAVQPCRCLVTLDSCVVANIGPTDCGALDCMLILDTTSGAVFPSSDNMTQHEDVRKLLIAKEVCTCGELQDTRLVSVIRALQGCKSTHCPRSAGLQLSLRQVLNDTSLSRMSAISAPKLQVALESRKAAQESLYQHGSIDAPICTHRHSSSELTRGRPHQVQGRCHCQCRYIPAQICVS